MLAELGRSVLTSAVLDAEICTVVQTKSVAETMVQIGLSSAGFVFLIEKEVGLVLHRVVDRYHLQHI